MKPSTTTFVVLGLLARRPRSGYDLAAFAERSVGLFWPISRSQLYTELSRLEALGWASGTTVEQDRYPNKRVYEATEAGLVALREWLEVGPPQQQRRQEPMVLKTFLGAHMDPAQLADQLRRHREEAEQLHAALSAVVGHLDAKGPTGPHRFGRLAARYGMLQTQATIAWTEEAQALLDAERPQR